MILHHHQDEMGGEVEGQNDSKESQELCEQRTKEVIIIGDPLIISSLD